MKHKRLCGLLLAATMVFATALAFCACDLGNENGENKGNHDDDSSQENVSTVVTEAEWNEAMAAGNFANIIYNMEYSETGRQMVGTEAQPSEQIVKKFRIEEDGTKKHIKLLYLKQEKWEYSEETQKTTHTVKECDADYWLKQDTAIGVEGYYVTVSWSRYLYSYVNVQGQWGVSSACENDGIVVGEIGDRQFSDFTYNDKEGVYSCKISDAEGTKVFLKIKFKNGKLSDYIISGSSQGYEASYSCKILEYGTANIQLPKQLNDVIEQDAKKYEQ